MSHVHSIYDRFNHISGLSAVNYSVATHTKKKKQTETFSLELWFLFQLSISTRIRMKLWFFISFPPPNSFKNSKNKYLEQIKVESLSSHLI